MRVTNNMMVRNMMTTMNKNLNRMSTYQYQMSSGKKIKVASDDPIVAARSMKLRSNMSQIEQYKKNVDDADSWMQVTESALSNLEDVVQRARELTVEAANGTLSDQDKEMVKAEIVQLQQSIVEISNASYAGRYVFAGYKTDEPPFAIEDTVAGKKITYQGNYLAIGGPVSSDIVPADFEAFYQDNLDKIHGQPELMMGAYTSFTAAAGDQFSITIDKTPPVPMQTIDISSMNTANLDTFVSDLQTELNTVFGSSDIVQVNNEEGRLKFTVLDGDRLALNAVTGSDALKKMGFSDNAKAVKNQSQQIVYKIGAGNNLNINVEGNNVFGSGAEGLFETFRKLEFALGGETSYQTASLDALGNVVVQTHDLEVGDVLADLDNDMNRLLTIMADVGAKTNYIELTQNRLDDDYLNYTELMSKNEDVDMAEAIMNLEMAENVYNASLSTGARIIQPTLVSFLS
ncbi:MAG: flagellar hook-associated protein FlgL [Clostridia bacterium]